MKNISGNFNTFKEEKAAVCEFLKTMDYDPEDCRVERYGGENVTDRAIMSAGDIEVTLPDGRRILFEVKQESVKRFSKWGQLGIDFLSVFHFKPNKSFDKKVHSPDDFSKFMDTVDTSTNDFKWGKIVYSKSEVWLFYVKNEDGSYHFIEGYDYDRLRRDGIIDVLSKNCQFAVNGKPKTQMSYKDTWESAVFFANPKDLEEYIITKDIFDML